MHSMFDLKHKQFGSLSIHKTSNKHVCKNKIEFISCVELDSEILECASDDPGMEESIHKFTVYQSHTRALLTRFEEWIASISEVWIRRQIMILSMYETSDVTSRAMVTANLDESNEVNGSSHSSFTKPMLSENMNTNTFDRSCEMRYKAFPAICDRLSKVLYFQQSKFERQIRDIEKYGVIPLRYLLEHDILFLEAMKVEFVQAKKLFIKNNAKSLRYEKELQQIEMYTQKQAMIVSNRSEHSETNTGNTNNCVQHPLSKLKQTKRQWSSSISILPNKNRKLSLMNLKTKEGTQIKNAILSNMYKLNSKIKSSQKQAILWKLEKCNEELNKSMIGVLKKKSDFEKALTVLEQKLNALFKQLSGKLSHEKAK